MTISSGVIDYSEINSEFSVLYETLITAQGIRGKDWSWEFDVIAGSSGTPERTRSFEFTAPDDIELLSMEVTLWNSSAVSRSVTFTVSAVAAEADLTLTNTPLYTPGGDPLSLTATSAVTTEVVSAAIVSPVGFLIRGARYRLLMAFSSAGVMNRTICSLVGRSRRRAG